MLTPSGKWNAQQYWLYVINGQRHGGPLPPFDVYQTGCIGLSGIYLGIWNINSKVNDTPATKAVAAYPCFSDALAKQKQLQGANPGKPYRIVALMRNGPLLDGRYTQKDYDAGIEVTSKGETIRGLSETPFDFWTLHKPKNGPAYWSHLSSNYRIAGDEYKKGQRKYPVPDVIHSPFADAFTEARRGYKYAFFLVVEAAQTPLLPPDDPSSTMKK